MAIYRRKRDGALYRCSLQVFSRPWPTFEHMVACYKLDPVWEGRTHYKTVAAFNREFEKERE